MNERKVELQVKQKNPMWASTSILVAAVLAVVAFVRGNWQIPLLVGAFAIWGLRVFMILGLPALRIRRNRRERKQQELEAEKARKTAEACLLYTSKRLLKKRRTAYHFSGMDFTHPNT